MGRQSKSPAYGDPGGRVIPTHALAVNGRTWMEIQSIEKGEENDLTKLMSRVDGSKIYSLILWKLPDGKSIDQTSPKRDATEYMQCAGSADRMTVEVRRLKGKKFEHFVVGRAPNNGGNPEKRETIHWESVETVVAPNEVFSSAEAAELFRSYYRTGWVPSSYVLRPLSI
jgi:hypothetical protein